MRLINENNDDNIEVLIQKRPIVEGERKAKRSTNTVAVEDKGRKNHYYE